MIYSTFINVRFNAQKDRHPSFRLVQCNKMDFIMSKQGIATSHISAGFTAVLVGYTSSVMIVIQAATQAGANAAQVSSSLLALGLAMGVTSIGFSWYYKTPILTAWSTPGAAMLIGVVGEFSLNQVIGAYIISAGLITLSGFIKPLTRLLSSIPPALAAAMLAAILLPFCVKAFIPLSDEPMLFCLLFISFMLAKQWLPRYAMAILLIVAIGYAIQADVFNSAIRQQFNLSIASPIWITPEFTLLPILNISIPLYIITMLSQNLPGLSMLKSYGYLNKDDTEKGYHAHGSPLLIGSGLSTMLLAPFGVFSINLAAISAAICMDSSVDDDPQQRYRSTLWAGGFYIIAGLWAGAVVTLFMALPTTIGDMLAGLALMGTLLLCLHSAFDAVKYRESALLTFVCTLSGITFLGIGAAVWGLLLGLAHLVVSQRQK
ncbi:benzoate/H(+) symporter BenE family transporter [Shewanella sp. MF05960]|uniref:benzoate/H(+) symporter BenE family transporter n=1 Tax=Shewanella sp. MF05960 TaxID=3434874 RepID=UPI003D7943B1